MRRRLGSVLRSLHILGGGVMSSASQLAQTRISPGSNNWHERFFFTPAVHTVPYLVHTSDPDQTNTILSFDLPELFSLPDLFLLPP